MIIVLIISVILAGVHTSEPHYIEFKNECEAFSDVDPTLSFLSNLEPNILLNKNSATDNESIPQAKIDSLKEKKGNAFSFAVDDVEQNKDLDCYFQSIRRAFEEYMELNVRIEDISHNNAKLVSGSGIGVLDAINFAYIHHYPLKLSVSDFIFMIGQGLSTHISVHSEELREHFVDFQGKEKIVILRPDLIPGEKNDWSTVFGEFSEEIRERVKTDFYDVLIDDTSVATEISKIVTEITMMETYKHYFDYVVQGCGFVKITLVGSDEDWEKLRSKVKKLQELNVDDKLDLNWWLDRLVPLVDRIVTQAISRDIDKSFWRDMFQSQSREVREEEETDCPHITTIISGWINVFYPYLFRKSWEGFEKSTFVERDSETVTSGVAKVPFTWKPFDDDIPMNIFGGCLGGQMLDDGEGTIEPVYFYAITYA